MVRAAPLRAWRLYLRVRRCAAPICLDRSQPAPRRPIHPPPRVGPARRRRRNGPEHLVNFHWPEDLQSGLQIEGALEMHCETFPPFLT
jgi:hypothetical protein